MVDKGGQSDQKNFTSKTKVISNNQLFNHYRNINFYTLVHPPLFQLHLHFVKYFIAGIFALVCLEVTAPEVHVIHIGYPDT